MHCGGATGRLDRDAILESMMASSVADGVVDPFDVADEPFSSPMGDPDREHEPELHSSDDEPVATKRSPFRSIGQFFWVAALIGFALLRNCAED